MGSIRKRLGRERRMRRTRKYRRHSRGIKIYPLTTMKHTRKIRNLKSARKGRKKSLTKKQKRGGGFYSFLRNKLFTGTTKVHPDNFTDIVPQEPIITSSEKSKKYKVPTVVTVTKVASEENYDGVKTKPLEEKTIMSDKKFFKRSFVDESYCGFNFKNSEKEARNFFYNEFKYRNSGREIDLNEHYNDEFKTFNERMILGMDMDNDERIHQQIIQRISLKIAFRNFLYNYGELITSEKDLETIRKELDGDENLNNPIFSKETKDNFKEDICNKIVKMQSIQALENEYLFK